MANALYKAAVRELEAVLPPRLVSQALQGGLTAVGKTADTLSPEDAETILQGRVLPRLTFSLGEEKAKATVKTISERLVEVAVGTEKALSLSAQARVIGLLQASLKPFNIYFEWSETQKLRAQLSLIETEHAAAGNAGELIAAAQLQLGVLQQKLNDQLSVQARELALLEATWGEHSALKSPKVRRLGGLLDLIRGAQEAQQRVPAEVERAHQLAGDLRAEKLRILGDEARELRALPETFSTLLALELTLAEKLSELQKRVEGGVLLGDTLRDFRTELAGQQEALRKALQEEFQTLIYGAENPELGQLLKLSLKVLETTLPPAADVKRIRDLLRVGDLDPKHLADFHRLETDAESYRVVESETGQTLAVFLSGVRETLEATHALPALGEGWTLLERAKSEQQRSAQRFVGRVAAAQSAALPLSTLNSDAALTLRWQLGALIAQQGSSQRVSPKRQAELEASLGETEALIESLQEEAAATRAVAASLLGGNGALDDMWNGLALFAEPKKSAKVTSQAAAQVASPAPHSELQGWLERQAAREGVAGLALFTESADTLVAGDLPMAIKTLQRAVRLTKRRADTLGEGLEQGGAGALSVETQGYTLVIFWLTRARSLALVTRAPSWRGTARQAALDALPELVALLEPVGANT